MIRNMYGVRICDPLFLLSGYGKKWSMYCALKSKQSSYVCEASIPSFNWCLLLIFLLQCILYFLCSFQIQQHTRYNSNVTITLKLQSSMLVKGCWYLSFTSSFPSIRQKQSCWLAWLVYGLEPGLCTNIRVFCNGQTARGAWGEYNWIKWKVLWITIKDYTS